MSVVQWCRVALIYGLGMLAPMTFGLMGPLTGDISAATHLPAQSAGLVFGIVFLPFLLVATFVGRAADRLGTRNMLLVGAALIVAADVSNMKADTAPWLLIDNFILGLGMIAIVVAGQTELSRQASGKKQARILSFWATAPNVGISIGLLLAGSVAATPMWRWVFAERGAATLILAVGALFLIPRRSTNSDPALATAGHHHGGGFRALFKERRVIRLSISFLCMTMTSSGSLAVWALFLSGLHHSSIATIARMTALTAPSSILGGLIAGYLLGRPVGLKVIVTTFVAVGIVSGIILYTPGSGLLVVGITMLAWTIAVGAVTSLFYATLPRFVIGQENMGAATGLLLQVSSFGGVCGAPLYFALAAMPKGASIAVIGVTIVCWLAFMALMPIWRSEKASVLPA